jgi:hypothetical protein
LGRAKQPEDTQKALQRYVPGLADSADDIGRYRIGYIIHKRSTKELTNEDTTAQRSEVIGLVSMGPNQVFQLPENLTVLSGPETGVLLIEGGYQLLPEAWNQGYATEALEATLSAFRRAKSHWFPYKKVYMQAIASPDNPASCRFVMSL